MSKHEKYDVVIAGGGPAGVIAAIKTAKEGLEVALLDKKPKDQIGNKTCGDALDYNSPKFLNEKLGLEFPHGEEVADPIEKMIIAGETPEEEIALDAPGFMVNRHQYGQRLLNEAEKLGVVVYDRTRGKKPIIESGKVIGVKAETNDGEQIIFRSKVTIDASGVIASLRRNLPSDFFPPMEKSLDKKFIAKTYREIIELKEEHPWRRAIVLKYEHDVPSPGYIWFFTKGSKRLNVGTGWVPNKKNEGLNVKTTFKKAFKKYYRDEDYKVLVSGGGQVPVRPPLDTSVAPGFLVAGDAAYHVEPATAEGHGPALVAGYYAGEYAAKAIHDNDVSVENLWGYNTAIFNSFGVKHAVGLIVANFLGEVGSRGIEFLLKKKVITQEDLGVIFLGGSASIGLGIIVRKMIQVFPKYNLLFSIKRLLTKAKTTKKIYRQYPDSFEGLSKWQKERDRLIPEFHRGL